MQHAPQIDGATLRAVEALIASPTGRVAVEQAEAENAAREAKQRADVMAAGKKAEAAAEAHVQATEKAYATQAAKAQKAWLAWRAEADPLTQLESERGSAAFILERVRGQLLKDLAPLGSAAIDAAQREIWYVEREVASTLSWQPTYKNSFLTGKQTATGAVEVHPDRHKFVKQCTALRAELEAMRLSTSTTPKQIEERCSEAIAYAHQAQAWIDGRAVSQVLVPPSFSRVQI